MIKRDELSNPESCINRAEDDEPLFVIRGKDPIAVSVVRFWCDHAERDHEHEKIVEAEAIAQEMADYQLKRREAQL